MGKGSSSRIPARWLAGLAVIGAMWVVAFEQEHRIPGLTYVNTGLHQFGHVLTNANSELVHLLAGSVAQVAIPLLVAVYFFFRRGDWVAAGVCLVWAATSAAEVSAYVADAPARKLHLLAEGDTHDWAYILGPEGYQAMHKAKSLADTIHQAASVAAIVGFMVCLAAPLKGRGRRPQPEGMAAASEATAASS